MHSPGKLCKANIAHNLFIAPGNAGTSQCGKNINISVNDFEAIKKFSIENNIEMIVVGPEEPLVKGVYDFFANDDEAKNIKLSLVHLQMAHNWKAAKHLRRSSC